MMTLAWQIVWSFDAAVAATSPSGVTHDGWLLFGAGVTTAALSIGALFAVAWWQRLIQIRDRATERAQREESQRRDQEERRLEESRLARRDAWRREYEETRELLK